MRRAPIIREMCCFSLRWFCFCVVILPLLIIILFLLAHPRAWNFAAWMVGAPDEFHLSPDAEHPTSNPWGSDGSPGLGQ